MALTIIGKVSHYPTEGEVKFNFQKHSSKKKKGEDSLVVEEWNTNLPFEIWKRFKDSEVEITVKKK